MALVHFPALNRPQRPVCSICIANYNGEDLLVECIDSVLAQDCDFPFEILVHDDASTDRSVALLRERYPQVEVLASDENVGFCVSNNRLVEHARGEFVLLLNNDAALFTDALTTLLGNARKMAALGILTLPQHDWQTGALVDKGGFLDLSYNPIPNLSSTRTQVAYVIGACLWIPRKLWVELGGFPEWMESIAEDIHLCCLARLRGHPVQAIHTSGYRHRQGASFGGNRATGGLNSTFRRRYLSERNRTFALVVLTPTILMWPWLALHLFTLALEGVALALLRLDARIATRIYGRAIAATVHQATNLCRHRRDTQSNRRIGLFAYLRAFRPTFRKLALLFRFGLPRLRA